MSSLLEKMKAKLARLEAEWQSLCENDPRRGHGGTPNIVDNNKGRRMIKVCHKYDERLTEKLKAIKDQKEKIERMEWKLQQRATQTKKSAKFLAKNPIHPALFELEKLGHVKQWQRNPEYFFVTGLRKVALITKENQIQISNRFPALTQEATFKCNELIQQKI